MKNEHKRGEDESHTLWTDREKGKREGKSKERRRESTPPPPPNGVLTHAHTGTGALRRSRPLLIQMKIDFFPLP